MNPDEFSMHNPAVMMKESLHFNNRYLKPSRVVDLFYVDLFYRDADRLYSIQLTIPQFRPTAILFPIDHESGAAT
ncbi:MAG: hypothetical protein CME31_17720 [Gimesia sp.]|uniref:Uncharacterized protein n=1 Tax=Gimesia maris TaxID=122 RepID=A0A3D3QYJ8_9PLAN|nr:hypothetical protein [Gimesia sp.]HCO21674.1 hypothetical protein [Gimesia maris]|tara:strand:+ start:61831 stop:62055 length:225 start_codon:yes stop_codon:yes gene_type:complete